MGRGLSEEREPESSQLLLPEQGIESEEFAKPGKKVARAEGVDAILGSAAKADNGVKRIRA